MAATVSGCRGRGGVPAAMLLLGLALGLVLGGPAAAGRVVGTPYALSAAHPPGTAFAGVRLLGTIDIPSTAVDGVGIAGLSGLAWDADDGVLYALSDRGRIFHLRPRFAGERLVGVELLHGYHLRGADGRILPRWRVDSEGLALEHGRNGVRGDAQLILSFEGQPRVDVYRPDARWLAGYSLPGELWNADYYASANEALESVARVAPYGVITAPERPVWGESAAEVPLVAATGETWTYPLGPETNAALVDLCATADDGVLFLERSWVSPFHPRVSTLRRVAALPEPGARLAPETVARFSSARGWRVDNFEGLARYEGNRYFMVSDDNERASQRTLLVHFELLEPAP